VKAMLITYNGLCEVIDTNGKYEEIREILQGFIEHVSIIKDGKVVGSMYVNEEGKLMGLPVNNVATTLYLRGRYGYDVIVGDALVFGEGDSDGNETSISPELTADIIRLCEHQTTE
jgi:hypothetical protein